jgi:hypothetical protein
VLLSVHAQRVRNELCTDSAGRLSDGGYVGLPSVEPLGESSTVTSRLAPRPLRFYFSALPGSARRSSHRGRPKKLAAGSSCFTPARRTELHTTCRCTGTSQTPRRHGCERPRRGERLHNVVGIRPLGACIELSRAMSVQAGLTLSETLEVTVRTANVCTASDASQDQKRSCPPANAWYCMLRRGVAVRCDLAPALNRLRRLTR